MSENTQEPTMEEILASIRRIISEDDPPAEAESAPEVPKMAVAPPLEEDEQPLMLEDDEVLELTQRVEDQSDEIEIAPIDDIEIVDPEPVSYTPPPMAAAPMPREEPLVSRPQASAAASAFDALERTVLMPPGGRTLEDVVREMLRPMLKDWLDQNLPSIVEAQVASEVERIARQRR